MSNKNQEVITHLEGLGDGKIEELSKKIHQEYSISKLLDGQEYDLIRLVNEIKDYLHDNVLKGFEAGKRLLAIKEKEGWGKFEKILEEDIGIPVRAAYKYIGMYIKLSKVPTLAPLGKSKLLAALSIPDEELEKLETEGTLFGIPKKKLELMSVRDFQAAIKTRDKRLEHSEKREAEKDKIIENQKREIEKLKSAGTAKDFEEVRLRTTQLYLEFQRMLFVAEQLSTQVSDPAKFGENARAQVHGLYDIFYRMISLAYHEGGALTASEYSDNVPETPEELKERGPAEGDWPEYVYEANSNTKPETKQ